MSPSSVAYASPKIASVLVKQFGARASTVTVRMRGSKDVSRFIRKIEDAQKKAAKSTLRFG